MTTRRGFLGAMLALAAAPAVVRADRLMRIMPPAALVLWGDGIHDDTQALNGLIQGKKTIRPDGSRVVHECYGANTKVLRLSGIYSVSSTIVLASNVELRNSEIIARRELDGPVIFVPSGITNSSVVDCTIVGNGKSSGICREYLASGTLNMRMS